MIHKHNTTVGIKSANIYRLSTQQSAHTLRFPGSNGMKNIKTTYKTIATCNSGSMISRVDGKQMEQLTDP